MSTEVVIPWRDGCPHREASFAWVKSRLEDHGYIVLVGEAPPGPWIKARAVQAAGSTADVLVIHDADVWCDGLADAVAAVEAGAAWAVPHKPVHRLSEEATTAVLAGDPFGGVLAQRPYGGHAGGGITVVARSVYESTPLDPRFCGWGQEDDSWAVALTTLHGPPRRGNAELWHLWHPPADRANRMVGNDEGQALFGRYRLGRRDPSAVAAVVNEARVILEGGTP